MELEGGGLNLCQHSSGEAEVNYETLQLGWPRFEGGTSISNTNLARFQVS